MISVVSLGVIVGVLNLNNNINALNNNKIEDQEVTKGITIIKELEAQDVLESEEKIELVQKGLQGILLIILINLQLYRLQYYSAFLLIWGLYHVLS